MNSLLLYCKSCCECCKNFSENLAESNVDITHIICNTVVIIAILALGAYFLWFILNHIINSIKSRKEQKSRPTSVPSTSRKSELEFERWFSLKKEYQKKALDYVWERSLGGKSTQNGQEGGKSEKKLNPSTSCENDTYLKYIKELISQIDNKLEAIHPSEKTQEKEM